MTTTGVVNTFLQNIAKKVPMPYDDHMSGQQRFAGLLRERTARRSQREVAAKAGVSPTTIGNYLLGRLPDLNDIGLIDRLSEALQTTPGEIREAIHADQEERAREAAAKALPVGITAAVEFALRRAGEIPDEGKRQILDFVREIEERYGLGKEKDGEPNRQEERSKT